MLQAHIQGRAQQGGSCGGGRAGANGRSAASKEGNKGGVYKQKIGPGRSGAAKGTAKEGVKHEGCLYKCILP